MRTKEPGTRDHTAAIRWNKLVKRLHSCNRSRLSFGICEHSEAESPIAETHARDRTPGRAYSDRVLISRDSGDYVVRYGRRLFELSDKLSELAFLWSGCFLNCL